MDARGLTQTDVSQRTGLSVTKVNDYLKARRPISPEKMQEMLSALDQAAPTVRSYIARFEKDVAALVKQLAANLETAASSQPAATPLKQRLRAADESTPLPGDSAPAARPRRRQAAQ